VALDSGNDVILFKRSRAYAMERERWFLDGRKSERDEHRADEADPKRQADLRVAARLCLWRRALILNDATMLRKIRGSLSLKQKPIL
jgi:hypothetical protein